MMPKETWTLAELAGEAGVPRRTIRYYIARGLLEGPVKAGRNSVYAARHLDRLKEIQRLQEEGRTLTEIAHLLAGALVEDQLPEPVAWQSFAIADDVTVNVRGDVSPWRMKLIRETLRDLNARLNGPAPRTKQGGFENADD